MEMQGMKRWYVYFFLIVLGLVLASCGGNEEPPPATAVPPTTAPVNTVTAVAPDQRAELTAAPWAWVRLLDQAAGASDVANSQNYTVSFQPDGALQVRADCNNAVGSFTTAGDSLTIALGPTTLAACAPESRSDQFLALLSAAARYQIGNGQLRIDLAADGGSLFFIPASAVVVMPTAVPSSPTPLPPTAVPPTAVPLPPGSVVDSGPRQYANGTFAAPYYTVAAGDTLYSIGLRFGLTTAQLIAANPGADAGIYAGQQLLISGSGGAVNLPSPGAQYERVNFDAGSIVAVRNGIINNAQPAGYVLQVRAGQTMEIATASNGEPLEILVQGPGGGLSVNGENGQINNNTWLPIPTTGDYYVTIKPVITPENPSLAFTITFVIQ